MTFSAAVVGLGYWGPNLARNLAASPEFDLVALCDRDAERLASEGRRYPAASCFADLETLLAEVSPDFVAIATPVASHFQLASAALCAGAHVLVEKPLTATLAEAEALVALAERVGRHLFVDHTFLFTGAVRELQRQVEAKTLGELLYVDSVRISLGLYQSDVDVVWDLAPHDLAILQAIIGRLPASVQVNASCHNPWGIADVAYLHLEYGDGVMAHLHLSWLSPVKVRRMIVAGSARSLIYDDLEAADKIKIYDHGVAFDGGDDASRRELLVRYRKGDMRAPALPVTEALAVQCAEWARTLRGQGGTTVSGRDGLAIVRVLAAATRSMQAGGAVVPLEPVEQEDRHGQR